MIYLFHLLYLFSHILVSKSKNFVVVSRSFSTPPSKKNCMCAYSNNHHPYVDVMYFIVEWLIVWERGALVRMTLRVNKYIPFLRKPRMVVPPARLLMEIHSIARTILLAVTIHNISISMCVFCSTFVQ